MESNAAMQSTTTVQEPIVQSGGSTPVSWDELESVSNYKTQVATQEKKLEKEVEKAVEKPSKRQESDSEESSEKEDDKPKAKDSKEASSKQDKKEVEKLEKALKLLKLKNGDSEVELRADALVPVKIDGKTVEVPLQEALNRYSQQTHVDKLFKDFKTQKETFEKDRKLISEALTKSYDMLSTKKDLRGFIEYIGEAMGVDAQAIYQEAVENIQKQVEEWNGLTPEEKRAKQLEEENAYYRQRMEAQKQQRESLKSQQKLEQDVTAMLDKYQMSKEALVNAYDDLVKQGYNPNEITPDFIGNYHSALKKLDAIETQIKAINPELLNDFANIEALTKVAMQIDANEQEIAEAVRQLYGDSPEQKLAKKIEKNQKKNKTSQPKNPDKDPTFFDDI